MKAYKNWVTYLKPSWHVAITDSVHSIRSTPEKTEGARTKRLTTSRRRNNLNQLNALFTVSHLKKYHDVILWQLKMSIKTRAILYSRIKCEFKSPLVIIQVGLTQQIRYLNIFFTLIQSYFHDFRRMDRLINSLFILLPFTIKHLTILIGYKQTFS